MSPPPSNRIVSQKNIPGPLTFRMMERVWSSMNSTRTWVTPPREPAHNSVSFGFPLRICSKMSPLRQSACQPAVLLHLSTQVFLLSISIQTNGTENRYFALLFFPSPHETRPSTKKCDSNCMGGDGSRPAAERKSQGREESKSGIIPVRPRTRVTLTSLTGALLLDSIVIDVCPWMLKVCKRETRGCESRESVWVAKRAYFFSFGCNFVLFGRVFFFPLLRPSSVRGACGAVLR